MRTIYFHKAHAFSCSTTFLTRMHSSRMLNARLLPVSSNMHCSGRGCTCQGVVPAHRGVPSGGCTCQGVPAQWGVPARGVPVQVLLPLCEQNDRQVQKYYLAPNFICGREKFLTHVQGGLALQSAVCDRNMEQQCFVIVHKAL